MTKSFTVTLLALLVLLSIPTIGNAFTAVSLPAGSIQQRPLTNKVLYSTAPLGKSTDAVPQKEEENEKKVVQQQKKSVILGSKVKSISSALGIAFLISRASAARNNAQVVKTLNIPSMKAQIMAKAPTFFTIGKLSILFRKSLGIIPGALMILFGGRFRKTTTTKNDDNAQPVTTTTTVLNAETTVTTKPAEPVKAEPVTTTTTAIKNDPTAFEYADSDTFPLMDKKYVHFRQSMRKPSAAKRAAAKYAQIESLEDRTFQMLLDLGLIQEHKNPTIALMMSFLP